jgi:nucleotide-binding universal stress UspA family protein
MVIAVSKAMYKKILVPLDASATAQTAAEHAIAMARACKAALRFITVVDLNGLVGGVPSVVEVVNNDARLTLDDWMNQASQWGLDVSTAIVETNPKTPRVDDAIVTEATRWGAELIVVGSHGRSGARHLMLGSVAEGVARLSRVPVLIVHPGEVPVA